MDIELITRRSKVQILPPPPAVARDCGFEGLLQKPFVCNQACKLRMECADEITEELHRNFAEIAPRALNILSDLAENAESESVRLGATRDLLDRAGFRPVDRHEIVKEKSVEELNAQLVSLVRKEWSRNANKRFQKQKKHF